MWDQFWTSGALGRDLGRCGTSPGPEERLRRTRDGVGPVGRLRGTRDGVEPLLHSRSGTLQNTSLGNIRDNRVETDHPLRFFLRLRLSLLWIQSSLKNPGQQDRSNGIYMLVEATIYRVCNTPISGRLFQGITPPSVPLPFSLLLSIILLFPTISIPLPSSLHSSHYLLPSFEITSTLFFSYP